MNFFRRKMAILFADKSKNMIYGFDGEIMALMVKIVRTWPMKPSISRAWAPRWSGSVIILFNSSL